MSLMNLRGNVLIATLLVLSISCGVTNPQPAPGTILGSGSVEVPNFGYIDYNFESGGESYGFVTFYYSKEWKDTEISSLYGIQQGSGDMAPATGYTIDFIDVVLSQSYFFRSDSLNYGYIYGRLIITKLEDNSSAIIEFNWIIQTEPNNREFY